MTQDKTGGSAFPHAIPTGFCRVKDDLTIEREFQTVGGMTLRDWYAGMALTAVMNTLDNKHTGVYILPYDETVASLAFMIADAMIAERNKA